MFWIGVPLAAVREDVQPVVIAGHDEVLDVVLVTRGHADDAAAAAVLGLVRR